MDVRDRARAYMRTVDPAISGQHGHNATFLAAVALVKGFGLTEAEALEVLRDEFNPRCQPPWREAALAYKVRSAAARGKPPPGCGALWLAGEAAEWEAGREGAKQPRSAEPARAVDEAAREDGVAVKLNFDPEVLRRCFRPEVVSAGWFMARSARVVEGVGPGD